MSRGKYGNPKTASRFICCKHLGENCIGQGIQRGSRQREKYHIKDLFCLQCACVTKCIEWRWCDDYEKVMEQADKLHKEIYEGDCTMKQQTEKKLQANLKAINNDFNTVIFADIEAKFKLMELEAIRILIDDCERLINEDAGNK